MSSLATSQTGPDTLRGEWDRYFSFIKRPVLPEQIAPAAISFKGISRILVLDLAIMAVLITAIVLAEALGFKIPANVFDELELTPLFIFLIVIGAPILEEIIFRGWLSGKPGHLACLAIGIGAAGAVTLLGSEGGASQAASIATLVIVPFALIAAVLCLILLRGHAPMGWFSRIFPVMFWLSTAAFAAMHFLNYTEGALPVLMLMVIPQFILGSIAGYVRVHYGLWASMLLHALHNGIIVAIVLASAAAFPEEAPKGAIKEVQVVGGQIFTAVPLAETISIEPVSPITA